MAFSVFPEYQSEGIPWAQHALGYTEGLAAGYQPVWSLESNSYSATFSALEID